MLSLRGSGQRRSACFRWIHQWTISSSIFSVEILFLLWMVWSCFDAFCVLADTLSALYIASVVLAEGILILRTYALWGRSKRVLFVLLFLAAVGLVPTHVCISGS